MELRNNPAYLRSMRDAVVEFQHEFAIFMDYHQTNNSLAIGLAPAVFPREDVPKETIALAAARVDLAAGRAAKAPQLTQLMVGVSGLGAVDPIAGWSSIRAPKPVLDPEMIVSSCNQMIGRLETMILEAESEAPPELSPEAMHPLIWGAAMKLWRDGHFRQAVAAAAETLVGQLKARTGRFDIAESALWQEAFSDREPAAGKPRLRWPGDPSDQSVRSMNDGLRGFAPGVQKTIRNGAAHGSGEMARQDALERLATLSLLAKWLDVCELIAVEEQTG